MKEPRPTLFRKTFSIFFLIVGSLALSFFYLTSYAHSLVFNTNYYLNIVTPLTKNADVAQAMSTYITSSLFEKTNAEEKIRNALPEQIKFLAPTLSTELQNRSYQRTTQIIQSDQFSSLWVAANTLFHEKILNIVRGGGILSKLQETQPLQDTSFQFDTSQLTQTIKERLGEDSQLFGNEQIQELKNVTIPVYTKLENIRQMIYWITQLTSLLLPLALALLLWGVAIAFSRQKAFLTAAIFLMVSMITTILAIQVLKNDYLNQIPQQMYHSAAQVVVNSFLSPLIQNLWLTFFGAVILMIIALLAGPYAWATGFRKSLGISQLQKSAFMNRFTKIRIFLSRYALWLRLLGIIIAIIALFVVPNITIATVVVVLSYLLIYLAILSFIFPRRQLARS